MWPIMSVSFKVRVLYLTTLNECFITMDFQNKLLSGCNGVAPKQNYEISRLFDIARFDITDI